MKATKHEKSNLRAGLEVFTIFALSVAFLVMLISAVLPHKAEASETHHTFWLIPHPDDEILSFGPAMINHQFSNNIDNTNHLVLLTGGEHSAVFEKLHKKGYTYLTREQFRQDKIKLFKTSAAMMQVEPENVHIYNLGDGDVTVEEVENIVRELDAKYPNNKFKSFSELDNHPDHANSGRAVDNVLKEGLINDVRFYAKNSQRADGQLDMVIWGKETHSEAKRFLEGAYGVYSVWVPEKGYWSAGTLSVPRSFEIMVEHPYSYYTTPERIDKYKAKNN